MMLKMYTIENDTTLIKILGCNQCLEGKALQRTKGGDQSGVSIFEPSLNSQKGQFGDCMDLGLMMGQSNYLLHEQSSLNNHHNSLVDSIILQKKAQNQALREKSVSESSDEIGTEAAEMGESDKKNQFRKARCNRLKKLR